ncbi:hypothetical protein HYH02_009477 [Chlamydomonas schloesseri]|uniref:Uncharacterized protein n=1 Tax=Chlamydomonas schloesseri TaxID=2026947 RepID=A0A835TCQ1_9CHLO|nr:hypothetical protein HYH02_009477 [Chlamydomonas schloesseri]|eukprot:KAG2443062.1 hypothetical protein HYH02_009477 [Chlamydomonas schloesseri]
MDLHVDFMDYTTYYHDDEQRARDSQDHLARLALAGTAAEAPARVTCLTISSEHGGLEVAGVVGALAPELPCMEHVDLSECSWRPAGSAADVDRPGMATAGRLHQALAARLPRLRSLRLPKGGGVLAGVDALAACSRLTCMSMELHGGHVMLSGLEEVEGLSRLSGGTSSSGENLAALIGRSRPP